MKNKIVAIFLDNGAYEHLDKIYEILGADPKLPEAAGKTPPPIKEPPKPSMPAKEDKSLEKDVEPKDEGEPEKEDAGNEKEDKDVFDFLGNDKKDEDKGDDSGFGDEEGGDSEEDKPEETPEEFSSTLSPEIYEKWLDKVRAEFSLPEDYLFFKNPADAKNVIFGHKNWEGAYLKDHPKGAWFSFGDLGAKVAVEDLREHLKTWLDKPEIIKCPFVFGKGVEFGEKEFTVKKAFEKNFLKNPSAYKRFYKLSNDTIEELKNDVNLRSRQQ